MCAPCVPEAPLSVRNDLPREKPELLEPQIQGCFPWALTQGQGQPLTRTRAPRRGGNKRETIRLDRDRGFRVPAPGVVSGTPPAPASLCPRPSMAPSGPPSLTPSLSKGEPRRLQARPRPPHLEGPGEQTQTRVLLSGAPGETGVGQAALQLEPQNAGSTREKKHVAPGTGVALLERSGL